MLAIAYTENMYGSSRDIVRHLLKSFGCKELEFVQLTTVAEIDAFSERLLSKEFSKVLICGKDCLTLFFKGIGKQDDERLIQKWHMTYNLPFYFTCHPNATVRDPDGFVELADNIKFCVETPARQMGIPSIPHFIVVNSVQMIDGMEREISALRPNYLVCDIETTGFSIVEDFIRAIGIAASPQRMFIIPGECLQNSAFRKRLKAMMEKPEYNWAGQNFAQFDNKFLRHQCDINVPSVFDTLLAHYLLDESQGGHSLDKLAAKYLNAQTWKTMVDDYATVPFRDLCDYLALDLHFNYILVEKINTELQETGRLEALHDEILLPAAHALGRIEQRGVPTDREFLHELDRIHQEKIPIVQEQLWGEVGFELNVNSPQQVSKYFYTTLGLIKRPGRASTAMCSDSGSLTNLCHPVAEMVLNLRRYRSINKKYVHGLLDVVDLDGRIRPHFKIFGTETGRLSCSQPNLQNLPSKKHDWFCDDFNIKNAFVPLPGWSILEFDYSQLEVRVLAWYSRDEVLMEAYQNNADIHRRVASLIYGVPEAEISSNQRAAAKTVVFGCIYGLSVPSLAADLGISRREAADIQTAFLGNLRGFVDWKKETENFAIENGYIESAIGRRRQFPCILDSNLGAIKRKAVNTPIQGLASDLCLTSVAALEQTLNPNEAQILLTVHDSIVLMVRDESVSTVAPYVKSIMENKEHLLEFRVPFTVEAKIGKRYGSLTDLEVA